MRPVIGIVVLALILAGGLWLYRFIQIDGCLDRGGRWDYTKSTCDFGPEDSLPNSN